MQTVLLIRCAGVGLGYCVLNSLVCIYYNVIIALALLYLFTSLRSNLLWASCDNDWNTKTCGDPIWFNTSGQPATACSCCIFCLHCFLNSFKSLISKLMNVQCSALVLWLVLLMFRWTCYFYLLCRINCSQGFMSVLTKLWIHFFRICRTATMWIETWGEEVWNISVYLIWLRLL